MLEFFLGQLGGNFLQFSETNIECLPAKLNQYITKNLTFGDIFNVRDQKPLLPYLFANATVFTNQSPFVFTREFFDYYQLNKLYACNDSVVYSTNDGIKNLRVSYALAARGSVPGFYDN